MPIWKEAGNWRFQFQLLGKRYSRQGFKTKASARAEMEKLRAQLVAAEEQPTQTVMAFSEVANDYLDCGYSINSSYHYILYRHFFRLTVSIIAL